MLFDIWLSILSTSSHLTISHCDSELLPGSSHELTGKFPWVREALWNILCACIVSARVLGTHRISKGVCNPQNLNNHQDVGSWAIDNAAPGEWDFKRRKPDYRLGVRTSPSNDGHSENTEVWGTQSRHYLSSVFFAYRQTQISEDMNVGEERLMRRPQWHFSEGKLQQNKTHQQQQNVWTTRAFLISHLSRQDSHAVWHTSAFF